MLFITHFNQLFGFTLIYSFYTLIISKNMKTFYVKGPTLDINKGLTFVKLHFHKKSLQA
ncbi:hypothetical protein KKA49_02800 [Patescibacteria group bacterium]|nr:hypothetical protein [Patescibacteria group bacterium]MBU1457922.1 hypothetical protein [Patescibacteria group bacterium]